MSQINWGNNYVSTNPDFSLSHSSYSSTSGIHGKYEYQELTEGNYRLSFSKDDSIYCSGNLSQYVSGVDASKIAKHITGYELLDDTKKIDIDRAYPGNINPIIINYTPLFPDCHKQGGIVDNFSDPQNFRRLRRQKPHFWTFQLIWESQNFPAFGRKKSGHKQGGGV